MRLAPLLALVLALGTAAPASADGALSLAFAVFPEVGVGVPFPAWGQLTARGPAGPAQPVPGQIVDVYLDGVRVATTLTTQQGGFRVDPVATTRGPHALHAIANGLVPDAPIATRSADVSTTAVVPPSAARDVQARMGATWNLVEVTWSPPADAGGGAIQGYTVHRVLDGKVRMGTFVAGTAFTDDVRSPGAYTYRVTAKNAAGDGPAAASAPYSPPPRPLSVVTGTVTLRVCDAGECTDGVNDVRHADGSGGYELYAVIHGTVVADGVPLANEQVTVRATATNPDGTRSDFENVFTSGTGAFSATIDLSPYFPDGSRVTVVPQARVVSDGGQWVGDEVFVQVDAKDDPCVVC